MQEESPPKVNPQGLRQNDYIITGDEANGLEYTWGGSSQGTLNSDYVVH